MTGTLFVVATPIGNLEDISLRALRVLGEVSVIAAEDTRRTRQLLARYTIGTPTTSLHEHNEKQKSPAILERLLAGEHVALVSDAGTPTISDPGRRLVRDARQAGVKVEAVPGPSAVMAAMSVSGFPGDTFTFLGFPPIRSKDRIRWFERLMETTGSIVFFEAPHRIRQTLRDLQTYVGDIEVSIGRELTKAHEELVIRQISSAIDALAKPRGEFTVVLYLGEKTDFSPPAAPSDAEIADSFYLLTETGGTGRREAVRTLAVRHHLSQREVYAAIERRKHSES